jgi:hypothetical protein
VAGLSASWRPHDDVWHYAPSSPVNEYLCPTVRARKRGQNGKLNGPVGLLRRAGYTNMAEACRRMAAQPARELALSCKPSPELPFDAFQQDVMSGSMSVKGFTRARPDPSFLYISRPYCASLRYSVRRSNPRMRAAAVLLPLTASKTCWRYLLSISAMETSSVGFSLSKRRCDLR